MSSSKWTITCFNDVMKDDYLVTRNELLRILNAHELMLAALKNNLVLLRSAYKMDISGCGATFEQIEECKAAIAAVEGHDG